MERRLNRRGPSPGSGLRRAARRRRAHVAPERVERLVALARGRRRALILTHDNPDPDSLASALALAQLFQERARLASRIAYGGIVGRAENRAMIRLLRIPLCPVARLAEETFDLACLVDTQPAAGNHSLSPDRQADVVIDHHPPRDGGGHPAFSEVGGTFGATSTILVEYLRRAGLTPSPEVATALLYGIKSDTQDLGRMTSSADEEAYLYLFPLADKGLLARIEHPALPAEYFRLTSQALRKARVYGDGIAVDLGEIYTPDMVAGIADQLMALEGMVWSLAYATYQHQLFLSLRVRQGRSHAGRLIREITAAHGGSAGGHGAMAGARLPMPPGKAAQERLKHQVLRAFLQEFGAAGHRGRPLLHLGMG